MNTLTEKINHLNQLVLDGKVMDAFELYYHPEVAMQENEQAVTVGKEENRKRELDFFSNVTEFRKASVHRVAVGENTTMVEWEYDYTHKVYGVRNYKQVSVQEWKDGLIIFEKFYYP